MAFDATDHCRWFPGVPLALSHEAWLEVLDARGRWLDTHSWITLEWIKSLFHLNAVIQMSLISENQLKLLHVIFAFISFPFWRGSN